MPNLGSWYLASTGNHQGLVISEATGASVAVVYDKADGSIVAAAPDMLAALEKGVEALSNIINAADGGEPYSSKELSSSFIEDYNLMYSAIEKARAEQ